MHWDGGWHMGGMGGWWILVVVVILALLWVVVPRGRRIEGDRESPEQSLKRRYAKGEIDRVTYERMLEDLRK